MNTKRLYEIVLMDLALELSKLHEDMERAVNSDRPIDEKLIEIKTLLAKIVQTEAMVVKFNSFAPEENNDDENNTK